VTLEIVLLGLLLSALIYFFCVKCMNLTLKKELRYVKLTPKVLRYLAVLLVEILKANIQVVRIILRPGKEPAPLICHFKVPLRTDSARMILANSITLTPGTITVQMDGDDFVVHCLDTSFREGIEDSVFVKLLLEMEASL
jgi:multicomponent Na+:H+ antiporter subunit E